MELRREVLLPLGQCSLGVGAAVADYNLDGNLDLYLRGAAVRPGALLDGEGQCWFKPSTAQAAFADPACEQVAALWFEANSDSRGGFSTKEPIANGLSIWGDAGSAMAADINKDGRLVLILSISQVVALYCRNEMGIPGRRLSISGPGGNPAAVGATGGLTLADVSKRVRCIQAGSGFNGRTKSGLTFGLPSGADVTETVIHWPEGTSQPFAKNESGISDVK